MVEEYKPTRPYLLFHSRFIKKIGNERWQQQMWQGVYALGWFREPCFAIDSQCRRYPLLDVRSHGLAWTIMNISRGRGNYGRLLRVEYVFGLPEQLTFDQAREEFVESVCRNRWWTASNENQKQFRERNTKYLNMVDLIEPVSLNGNWPKVK